MNVLSPPIRPASRGDLSASQQEKRPLPRVGIVGAGGFGSRHAKILAGLAGEGFCELVAACDPRLESLQEDWSAEPLCQARLFQSHEQMFQAETLDYIVIASPPHWHEEHCLRAMETGAFIYLEKPPVPTFTQLRDLLSQPGADRVAVGFQMLEAPAIRNLKQELAKVGKIHEIWASGLWPRMTSYYRRTGWAGKMMMAERPVFDGPLTNALAHLVQNVFFLAGEELGSCALPSTAAGFFARAQPIESYDFGWIKGTMENGISYNILAGHCSRTAIPWKVSVRTDRGVYSIEEKDIPSGDALLMESHRSYLMAQQENPRITTRLSDCLGYSMATSTAWLSSPGIVDIPAHEVTVHGSGDDTVYHVESIHQLVENLQTNDPLPSLHPSWMKWEREANCRDTSLISRYPGLVKPMLKMRKEISSSSGFTIVELLVVMAIIGLLAVVALSSTSGETRGVAASQAANEVSDLFDMARSEAVKTQGQASIIVDDYPDPNNPLNCLHRLMVVDNVSGNTYAQVSLWYNLPTGVYYYPKFSGPLPPTSVTINNSAGTPLFSGNAYVFTYSLNGQCGTSSQVVVAQTVGTAPTLTYQDQTLHGFYLHTLGRPIFFPDLQSIQPTQ